MYFRDTVYLNLSCYIVTRTSLAPLLCVPNAETMTLHIPGMYLQVLECLALFLPGSRSPDIMPVQSPVCQNTEIMTLR